MSLRSSFSAVKPLPGSKREFPNVPARVNSGIKRGNGAHSTSPMVSAASAQSVPIPNRPAATRPERIASATIKALSGTKKTLDDFVRKPFRATPVPATTYRQPTVLLAQRPPARPSVRKGVANAKLESDKVSPFRAKPVPISTYRQPKEHQLLSKKEKAKAITRPIATTENQDLPVVVKPNLTVDVVVEELPPLPSVAGNDQDALVIPEPESVISTQDNTCLEDEDDDDDCWGAMGDWVSELDEKPDEEEISKFKQLEDPVEPHVEPPVEEPAISYRSLFKLKRRQYTKPELATIWEENEEDISPDNQHPIVIMEPDSDISTQDNTCLEDEDDDDDGWGAMGEWVSEL